MTIPAVLTNISVQLNQFAVDHLAAETPTKCSSYAGSSASECFYLS